MHFIRRAALAALFAICAAPVGAAAQETPTAIYADGLAAGWNNWSWATVTLGVAASDGERPVMVEAGPWSSLYFQHAPLSTSNYSKLTFFVNGGTGGQTLQVLATGAGNEPITTEAFRFNAPANSWGLVEVPLADIGVANAEVTGFWIQNGSPEAAAPFFVNYMALE